MILFAFSCWLLLALVPMHAPTCRDIVPIHGGYHLAVLVTFVAYLVVVWMVSLVVTAFVDEPCIRVSQRLARLLMRRKERTSAETGPAPGKCSAMATAAGAVGSPER